MSTILGKINLLQLHGVVKKMKGQSGEIECLVIPIEKNKLFKGTNGIYLDLIAFEIREKKADQKDTHLLKQSFSKEDRENMTEEELKSLPILGNLRVWSESQESESVSSSQVMEESDDLPF